MPGRPDFFILGAPKCGTTALSEYLRDHPQVFVSRPKEPHYFCDDFDYYYAPGQRTEEHYLRLFDAAGPQHLAVGEASVWYLYSATAARNIMAFDPRARVIVMVRNPVELVPSLHSQLRYMLDEDEPDPEAAWRLQAARARGERLPSTVRVPAFLQYGAAAALGAQLRRVYEAVPREQVKVIVFDDLRRDAGAVYRETLAFLGVPDDGRDEFPRVNENKVHGNAALARLTQRPPGPLVAVARGVKRVAGVQRLGVLDRVRRRNRLVTRREEISPAFAQELREHFRQDVAELGELIGRDLSAWTA
ncbi:sulfotransferase [Miltoncostaea marina]|uniref:sulfotransferase n=1 Tax=Miltoncostaea marina TaxID=2843215 RepID=UPI001C3E2DF9|nr:sulfotransferase [Miltoncostaea marina]